MKGLRETLASLSVLRSRFKSLLSSADARQGASTPSAAPNDLRQLDDFGSNPGNLRMLFYVPRDLPKGRPLVVALHGCTQTAAVYDYGSGWSTLADREGFAVLYPEQQRANNPNTCFNWFVASDTRRDQGEAHSIRQMIACMVQDHGVDRSKVFIAGLSAGGAMTAAMLAAYPDVFAGGAIIAGLPHGAATNVQEAFEAMAGRRTYTAEQWGDVVRAASPHKGPWPRLSVWHGSGDAIVNPQNMESILQQWTEVHRVSLRPHVEHDVHGHQRRAWRSDDGVDVIEAISVTGMPHGVPLATTGVEGVGHAGAYHFDVGISSTQHIANFWGIAATTVRKAQPQPVDRAARSVQPEPADAAPLLAARSVIPYVHQPDADAPQGQKSNPSAEGRLDPQAVIAAALKAAGLLGPPTDNPLDPRRVVTSTLRAVGVLKDGR
jgi:poly(hydroxyalkanoate) depolymerase family esterase